MLLSVLAIFAVLSIAVACGDDDSGGMTPADGATTAGGTTEAPSGTITIRGTQFETWDPHFSDFAPDIAHFYMVWRGLYEFDLSSPPKPIPSLAEGMPTVSDGGKTYTVKIKQGLKWSNGDPVTADDFVAGIQRTCNPDNAGHYEYVVTEIVGCDDYYNAKGGTAANEAMRKAIGVRAVDANTVEYKLTDPVPTFTTKLAMWESMPLNSKKIATADAKWPGPMENSYTGPFMPRDYTEKDHITLVPNPNWSGANKPKVTQITIKYIDDTGVAQNAYRNGELDATFANALELTATRSDPTLSKELVEYPATQTIGLEFNLNDPLMANKNFRVALSRAVDRVTLNKVVNQGANVPTTNWMPEARSGVKEGAYDSLLGFDATAAKAAFTASGLTPDKASFTLLLTDTALNKTLGQFLQNAWKTNLGIDVKLEFVDSKTRASRFNKTDFQLVTGGWTEDYSDPENWMLGLWQTGSSINKTKASIPALDALLKQAQFNQNDAQRRQEYADAEKLLLDGANGIAPLWHASVHVLVKPYIKGMAESRRPGDRFAAGDWNPENWSTSRR
jgi:oligopeptide transport system substrate-binding protein